MKRFLLLASLAAVAVGGVAAVPAADAAKVTCKLSGKNKVKCPKGKLKGPRGPAGPAGATGAAGSAGAGAAAGGATRVGVFMQAGDPQEEFLTLNGAVLEINCDDPGGDFQNANIRGTAVDDGYASVRGVDTSGDAQSQDDEDFNTGEDVDLDAGEFDGTYTLIYAPGTQGGGDDSITDVTYAIEDGDPLGNQFDCVVLGTAVTV